MPSLFSEIKSAFDLLTHFCFGEIYQKIRRRVNSQTVSYGLRRDLNIPFEPVHAKIPITVRPISSEDIPQLLGAYEAGGSKQDVAEELERLSLLRENIPTCYVAVNKENTPCYIQWLMGSLRNEFIQRRFKQLFPVLAADEALLEAAYTPAAHRGLGIMAYAMGVIAKKAESFHARWVITFVKDDNIPSLKGCKKAGFVPYILREENWFLFKRTLRWTPLPEGTPYPFDAPAQAQPARTVEVEAVTAPALGRK